MFRVVSWVLSSGSPVADIWSDGDLLLVQGHSVWQRDQVVQESCRSDTKESLQSNVILKLSAQEIERHLSEKAPNPACGYIAVAMTITWQ